MLQAMAEEYQEVPLTDERVIAMDGTTLTSIFETNIRAYIYEYTMWVARQLPTETIIKKLRVHHDNIVTLRREIIRRLGTTTGDKIIYPPPFPKLQS